jgi:hypothetical protein
MLKAGSKAPIAFPFANFCRLMLGDKTADIGHIPENIMYVESLRRGYTVSVV